jgi:cold shock CspA family protein
MSLQGLVTHWNELKGYGFISVTRAERYYFHVTHITEGPVGDLFNLIANFDVAEGVATQKESKNKTLPQAINVPPATPADDKGVV